MKKATRMVVSVMFVVCPECGYNVEGWLSDPREAQVVCDECNVKFEVPHDIDLEVW